MDKAILESMFLVSNDYLVKSSINSAKAGKFGFVSVVLGNGDWMLSASVH
jgi:hypothetical protein